jgi:acetyl esterase/lipase
MRKLVSITLLILLALNSTSVFPRSHSQVQVKSINYCTIDGFTENMDIYAPNTGFIYPLILFIHGGAWIFGDKTVIYNITFDELVSAGFVVASVNYYMPNSSGISVPAFPLNIEDVSCAIRYLRANSVEYGINASEIGLFGQSAGSNIALLIQTANQNSS